MKDSLFQIIASSLSFILPKKSNLIILGGGDRKQFQGNGKYLLLYLKASQNKDLEFYWSAFTKKQRDYLRRLKLPFINPYSLKGFFKILRAKYLFLEKSTKDVYYSGSIIGRFNFIQTWHGTPMKKIGHEDIVYPNNLKGKIRKHSHRLQKQLGLLTRQRFKLILATSPKVQELFIKVFDNERVRVLGYPRNDVLFHTELAVDDLSSRFLFQKFNRIILYAPTFRDSKDSMSPFSMDLEGFNQQLKAKNFLFLIKKHPWQKNIEIQNGLSHILDISEEVDDIQELYPHVDLLVNDFSGAFFDFLMTGRPIIYYPYDYDQYIKEDRQLNLDYKKDLPGPFATTEAELIDLIFSVDLWSQEKAYRERYRRICEQFNQHVDGSSSIRLLQYLYPTQDFKEL